MVTCSLSTDTEQNSHVLNNHSTLLTFIIITKNRSKQIKQLINSILKANLSFSSLLLIDDSDVSNFKQNQVFLKSLSIPFQQLSSSQAIEFVEQALEKMNLTRKELNFIRNSTGVNPPFKGFVERLLKVRDVKNSIRTSIMHFAPYSIARNLGIFCAVRCFRPAIVFFLDDDCRILDPTTLDVQVNLIGRNLGQQTIVAVSGFYKELNEVQEITPLRTSIIGIIRGMDVFLRKSLGSGVTRFQAKPPHMLGGALILSKRVFTNLPFDPYVARGEDHMFALDLAKVISQNELFLRDASFIVDHGRYTSEEKLELNVLRDIFRFMYSRVKTGRTFIPFFLIRWVIASIIDFLLCSHNFKKCIIELYTLLYIGHKFAKKQGNVFRENFKAWRRLIEQMTTGHAES